MTWLATTGGVFSTGTGPAYPPWTAASPAGQPLDLVRAAILAANAHNTQPWLFTVANDRIDLYADMSRTIGAMDSLLRELHISLGCAVENLTLAGPPNGIATVVTLLPDPAPLRPGTRRSRTCRGRVAMRWCARPIRRRYWRPRSWRAWWYGWSGVTVACW